MQASNLANGHISGESSKKGCTIWGFVLCESTGEGLSGIRVEARSANDDILEGVTDEEGRYEISGLCVDRSYTLSAFPSEAFDLVGDKPSIAAFSLESGETFGDISILMRTASSSISGQVVDVTPSYDYLDQVLFEQIPSEDTLLALSAPTDGKPLSGVSITLLGPSGLLRRTTSDRNGRFSFQHLISGQYTLRADAIDRAIAIKAEDNIVLTPNERRDDLKLSFRLDAMAVEGHITDTRGHPVIGAEVVAVRERRNDIDYPSNIILHEVHGVCDKNGYFHLDGLIPADAYQGFGLYIEGSFPENTFYRISARANDLVPQEILLPVIPVTLHNVCKTINKVLAKEGFSLLPEDEVPLPRSSGNTITGIDFVLADASALIAGHLYNAQYNALTGWKIQLQPIELPELAPLVPKHKLASLDTLTDATGCFRFEKVPPGNYVFRVNAHPDQPSKLQTTRNKPFSISEGQRLEDFDVIIDLPEHCSTIAGLVVDATTRLPIPGFSCEVSCVDENGRVTPIQTQVILSSDGSGTFIVKDICFKEVQMKIVAPNYASTGIDIDIFPGQTNRITVSLVAEGILRIYMTRNGELVQSRAQVVASRIDDGRTFTTHSANEMGAFEIKNLEEGDYSVMAACYIAPGDPNGLGDVVRQEETRVQIQPGNSTDLDFDFDGESSLALSISSPEREIQVLLFDGDEPIHILTNDPILKDPRLRLSAWIYNKSGYYEINGLSAGTYHVIARWKDQTGTIGAVNRLGIAVLRPKESTVVTLATEYNSNDKHGPPVAIGFPNSIWLLYFMSMMMRYPMTELTTKTYSVFDKFLCVISESQWLSEHIHCFLGPTEVGAHPNSSEIYRLAVFENGTRSTRYVYMCCPELGIARTEQIGNDVWILFRRIFMRLALSPHLPQYVLHASCVTNGCGKVALVIGVSDAGKTSVMLGLLRSGYTYVTDDYSCLRFSDGKVRALPVGCTVTEHTFRLFPEVEFLRSDSCKFFCQGVWQWTINPSDLYPFVRPNEAFEPTHLFFLYPAHGQDSNITPLSREESLWWFQTGRLLSTNVTPGFAQSDLDHHQKSFRLATSVIDRVRCYRVTNGDIYDTVNIISETLV